MAKQRKTIGTGITARQAVTYDDDDIIPAITELFSQWNANREKGGGDYGAVLLDIIKQCHQIIANSGAYHPDSPADFAERTIHETDSPADFAERIIHRDKIVKGMIARGNADAAARFAYEVGVLATQAKMKMDWEKPALIGKKNLEAIQHGSSIANQDRHQWRVAFWKRCNAKAALIWKKSPNLSKHRVAKIVQSELKLPDKIDTIARNLKKPGTAR